jgi:hypothetical protein
MLNFLLWSVISGLDDFLFHDHHWGLPVPDPNRPGRLVKPCYHCTKTKPVRVEGIGRGAAHAPVYARVLPEAQRRLPLGGTN